MHLNDMHIQHTHLKLEQQNESIGGVLQIPSLCYSRNHANVLAAMMSTINATHSSFDFASMICALLLVVKNAWKTHFQFVLNNPI